VRQCTQYVAIFTGVDRDCGGDAIMRAGVEACAMGEPSFPLIIPAARRRSTFGRAGVTRENPCPSTLHHARSSGSHLSTPSFLDS